LRVPTIFLLKKSLHANNKYGEIGITHLYPQIPGQANMCILILIHSVRSGCYFIINKRL